MGEGKKQSEPGAARRRATESVRFWTCHERVCRHDKSPRKKYVYEPLEVKVQSQSPFALRLRALFSMSNLTHSSFVLASSSSVTMGSVQAPSQARALATGAFKSLNQT
jgi:hypothetical protein